MSLSDSLTMEAADVVSSFAQQRIDAIDVAARLKFLRRLAWWLDAAGRVPGTRFRFGLNSLIGLAPVAGDFALSAVSLYIVWEARRLGVPNALLARMVINVAIEAALGAIPIAGDVADVMFKANLRNLALIESHFFR